MDDIDSALARLANDRVPSRLALTEGSILDRVSSHSFAAHELSNGFRVMAVSAALIMGIAVGLMPAGPEGAEQSLSPIGGAAFAPSTLLTAGR